MQTGANETKSTKGTSLVSNTIGVITRHIRLNELGPGDRLPSETALSRELNVSRTVVREAFRSLAAMRLIDLSVGKRATVAQLDHGAMSLMIEHGIDTEQINVQQIYDVRRTIEMRTSALAALRRTEVEAETIRNHALSMHENIADAQQVMEHDLAFHIAIARTSKNPIFAMILGAFQGVSRQTWPIGWRSRISEGKQETAVITHIELAEAIAVGDPLEAKRLMAAHFDESVAVLLAAGLA